MTDHTPMSTVSRLDVISTGARRRWALAEKQRIVAESRPTLMPVMVSFTTLAGLLDDYRSGCTLQHWPRAKLLRSAARQPIARASPRPDRWWYWSCRLASFGRGETWPRRSQWSAEEFREARKSYRQPDISWPKRWLELCHSHRKTCPDRSRSLANPPYRPSPCFPKRSTSLFYRNSRF